MNNELKNQAEKVCYKEKVYKETLRKKEQTYAKMFLETDFEKELDLEKKATEKQKEYYIKTNENYKKLVEQCDKRERLYKYEQKIYEIMLLEVSYEKEL